MDKIYSVFISSTQKDLKKYRENLQKVLVKNQFFTFAMENFTASSKPSLDLINNALKMTDFYVLVIGGLYGSIVSDEKISYTEKEFDIALSKNIPIFVFEYNGILDELHKETDEKKIAQLEKFKRKARESRNITFFSDFEDLNALVISALSNEVKDTTRPGWIRGTNSKITKEYVIVIKFDSNISQEDKMKVENVLFGLNLYLFPSDKTIPGRPIFSGGEENYIFWKFIISCETTLIADIRRRQFEDVSKSLTGFISTDWMEFRGFKYL